MPDPEEDLRPLEERNGQKASTAIKLGTLGVLSLLLVGSCAAHQDDSVDADCVDLSTQDPDGSYAVVDDAYCDDDHDDGSYSGSRGAYRWYYGGNRSGNRVRGGTTIRPANVEITTRSGRVIQRGGFGFHFGGGG